ncbi:MAG: AAA family ATPase, partial [Alcaligenaceae bacterium]
MVARTSASDELPLPLLPRLPRQLPEPTLPLPGGVTRGLPTHTSQEFRHMPRHVWLVRDVFHGGEVVILWGESQAGKTALLLDMVAAIASGSDWAGHPVTRTNVLYVALEGQIGVRTRVQALEYDQGIGHLEGVHYVFKSCNVTSENDVNELALTARKHDAKFIVIDTLSASIAGMAEENSNSAMSGMIANVQRLTQMTGAAVLLVHHCGNDPKRGARGAYALHANPDVSIEVGRSGEDRYWRLDKGRDGEPAGGCFKIEGVTFQPDHEPEPLKSIVVRHIEGAEAPSVQPPGSKAKTYAEDRAKLALQAISQHLNAGGQQCEIEAPEKEIEGSIAAAFK